jgi:tetratricopeptide (TPR) repeat protein
MLDQAETELGPSLDIKLARLDYWSQTGGDAAKAAVARLAKDRQEVSADDQPAFLDRLATVEAGLGAADEAREHLRELAGLQPVNIQALMGLFDLAMQAADRADALCLVTKIRSIEGEEGTAWRLAQALCFLDQARRDRTENLRDPRRLAAEIAERRPDWWGSAVLLAEMAELTGQTDEAKGQYTRAIELGNNQPRVINRLVALLNQDNQFKQIEDVIKILRRRNMAAPELIMAAALNAIRGQDYDRGIALAREVLSERSSSFADHLMLGQVYISARQPARGGDELRRAVELGPGVPLTWLSYIQYLVQQKRLDEAKVVVNAARRALPADRAGLAIARCDLLVGDTAHAETMIQSALNSPACDPGTIRGAAELYFDEGRFDRVEPLLDKLRDAQFKPNSEVLAWANRMRVKARLKTGRVGEIEQALGPLDQNLKADPGNKDDLKLKALVLATSASRRGEAIKLFEPLDEAKQLDENEQFILAQTYLAERLVDRYRGQVLKILATGARNPAHLFQFVDFLIGSNELDQADHWLAELITVAPQSLHLLEREARLLKARNRDGELLALLQARGKQVPDEIGMVAGMLDRFGFAREAEAAYQAFIALNPGDPERPLRLASFLARHDRTKEAVTILDRAWKACRPELVAATSLPLYLAPSADDNLRRQVETWVTEAIRKNPAAAASLRPELALIYTMQERYDEAEDLLRRTLSTNPNIVKALNLLAWILALRDQGKASEALDLVNRAINIAGATSSLVDTRAVALIRTGQLDQAARELRDGQAVDPKNLSLALHLAWAYHEAGNIDQARTAFQQAQELGFKPESRDPLERRIIDRLRERLATGPSTTPRGC